MKVYELAKSLGVKSNVIIEMLSNDSEDNKKKITATTILTEEQIDFVNVEMETIKEEEENKVVEEVKTVKKDEDYKPTDMIVCHSVFSGTLHFTGKHSGLTYDFIGAGSRRNVEYQDLKAAMLEGAESIYHPDIIIDDEDLINDEKWSEVKAVYENMITEDDIKKIIAMNPKNFRAALEKLPITAKKIIISMFAEQIERGTFEQYNKAVILDEICGTRFDLILH